jgi:hypothetical protein
MKKFVRYSFISYFIMFTVYAGGLILIDINRGRDVDFLEKIIYGFVFIIMMGAFNTVNAHIN